ncbi:MAG: PcfB family protein, partial [Oscillospiraceae bacterium]|nr:PcfB family protein [Oscillospiraceae bacterium]
MALSIRTGKLTARTLAYALQAAGRKIQKERRAHQTPHGRQSVKQLMAHGAAMNSIELTGAPRDFDRVARKWNVDYAFYKTGPDKYL